VKPTSVVLDPFAGTGTTLVECKKAGVKSIGVEVNPFTHLVSSVKVDWAPEPADLLNHAQSIRDEATRALETAGTPDDTLPLLNGLGNARPDESLFMSLDETRMKLLVGNSISPLPLHKTLVLLEYINKYRDDRFFGHERLAVAKGLASDIGNLSFGPEVGVRSIKKDAPVVSAWFKTMQAMCLDLEAVRENKSTESKVIEGDARKIDLILPENAVDFVLTSPPYPNEKDYTRMTRLESVILGFAQDKHGLRQLKSGLLPSNTRNVYQTTVKSEWTGRFPAIEELADRIESRRVELGKTSGFEKLYARVVRLYFDGMAQHLAGLRASLRRSARLVYVVGDQESFFRVPVQTGELLATIAEHLGYELMGIELMRRRFSTGSRQWLREEAVILRWPG